MSVIAILALALGAVWRLRRFTARLVLLGALIAVIVSYTTRGASHHAPRAPAQTVPARPAHRPPRMPARTSRATPVKRRVEEEGKQ